MEYVSITAQVITLVVVLFFVIGALTYLLEWFVKRIRG